MIQIQTLSITSINNALKELWRKICCIELLASSCCYEVVTLEQAQALRTDGKIVPNKLYKITGVHKNKPLETIQVLYDDGTNSGTSIFLTGLSNTEFSTEGWGEFWNPKYDQSNGYGSEDVNMLFNHEITFAGTNYNNGTGIAVTGGSGTGMLVDITTIAGEVVSIIITDQGDAYASGDVITINDGDDNATFIIGRSNYLYNIWDGDNPDPLKRPLPTIGYNIIWGGYVWENVNGLVGTALSYTELDSEWTKVAYNTTDYNLVVDYIEYDLSNDWILRRRQAEPVIDVIFPFQFWNSVHNTFGVTLHAISVTQWGNKYSKTTDLGIGLIDVSDSYLETANFKGKFMLGIELDQYSYVRNCYRGINTFFEGLKILNYSHQVDCIFNRGSSQKWVEVKVNSWQEGLTIDNDSTQWWLVLDGNCLQQLVIINNSSIQAYNSYLNGGSAVQLTIDNNSEQQHCTFIASSSQFNVLLDNASIQDSIQLQGFSTQANIILDNASHQDRITLETASFQGNVSLDNSIQQFLHFINVSGQQNEGGAGLIMINNALQEYLFFANNTTQSALTLDGATQSHIHFDSASIDYGTNTIAGTIEDGTRLELNSLKYSFNKTFDGGAGNGQVGAVTIQDMYVPLGFFISNVKILSVGLAGGVGSNITLGIDTDDVDSGLDATTGLVTTLAALPIYDYSILPFTQATALRKLVMAANTTDVTAGTITLIVTLSKL